jgi:hypothetical protein
VVPQDFRWVEGGRIQNQHEFFMQRMGGPPLFSQRRGTYAGSEAWAKGWGVEPTGQVCVAQMLRQWKLFECLYSMFLLLR